MKAKKKILKENEKGWKLGKLMRSKKGYTGSLLPFVWFNMAIMIALYLTTVNCDVETPEGCNPYVADEFFASFFNFSNWGASTWVQWMTGALAAGSAVLISATILGWKTEFPIFAGWAGLLFSTFLPTYTTLYSKMQDLFGDGVEGSFFAMLFLAPIAIGWIIVLGEFARGRD